MTQDLNMIEVFYNSYVNKVNTIREHIGHALTYAEKILYVHLYNNMDIKQELRTTDYAVFRPDRVAMQDATAQMALLQFMNAGKDHVTIPTTVHCDHLIKADKGMQEDLQRACDENGEVYHFLKTASRHYGIGFWQPGAGIIHQVILENYAFPGGMMLGTDSHTPNAGGLGMMGIGVGGGDAVDALTGQPWELKIPKIVGVHLKGKLNGWASPKDVILKILSMLTTKGGTNTIFEYYGDGVATISATGRATICNMGAELGATCSLFLADETTEYYLSQTGREDVAKLVHMVSAELKADKEVYESPNAFYDKVLEINLSEIEPALNGPFSPDLSTPLSEMTREKAKAHSYPTQVEVALVGSCTNSSYEDLSKAASVAKQAVELDIAPKAKLIICPGSEQIRQTTERDGILDDLRKIGAVVMANACGPCIGQWHRYKNNTEQKNAIVTSFNRNFRCRADGNPNTYAFISSPEIAVAMAISGDLCFNPMHHVLQNRRGENVKLSAPQGKILPEKGFVEVKNGFVAPDLTSQDVDVAIPEHSDRLQRLVPFTPIPADKYVDMPVLTKVSGKCTTDHISPAGKWLRYRGHLEHISDNMLTGSTNAFNGKVNQSRNQITGQYMSIPESAKLYKNNGYYSIIVAEENYGEGSSREHAAMEPRYLHVAVIIAKSFARIHETNLKKQGLLALTFADKNDYDMIREDDSLSVNLSELNSSNSIGVKITHKDGTVDHITANHTYNEIQIKWLKAGSALNYLVCNKKS